MDVVNPVRRVNVSVSARSVSKQTAGAVQIVPNLQTTAVAPSCATTAGGQRSSVHAAQSANKQETSVRVAKPARNLRVSAAVSVGSQTAASAAVAVSGRTPSVTAVGGVRPSNKIVPASKLRHQRQHRHQHQHQH